MRRTGPALRRAHRRHRRAPPRDGGVDLLPHIAPRRLPRLLREERVGLRTARCTVLAQGVFNRADELGRRVGDPHQPELSIWPDHVGQRGRDDRQAGREIFGGLGRADEPGGVVERKRQQRHLPVREICRQQRVRSGPEQVNVRPLRNGRAVELGNGPDQYELPVGPLLGDRVEERQVHALVNHAGIADPRPGDAGLISGFLRMGACLPEVRDVDAAGTAMDTRMPAPLRVVQASPAGEDDIGAPEQLPLPREDVRRRELEGRELVHAVEDNRHGLEISSKRKCHGREIPQHVLADASRREELPDQGVEHTIRFGLGEPGRHVRLDDEDAARIPSGRQARPPAVPNRFLDEEDAAITRKARHQVLRALKNEAPPQVGEANQVRVRADRVPRGGLFADGSEARGIAQLVHVIIPDAKTGGVDARRLSVHFTSCARGRRCCAGLTAGIVNDVRGCPGLRWLLGRWRGERARPVNASEWRRAIGASCRAHS